jgi:hypothetical protein
MVRLRLTNTPAGDVFGGFKAGFKKRIAEAGEFTIGSRLPR